MRRSLCLARRAVMVAGHRPAAASLAEQVCHHLAYVAPRSMGTLNKPLPSPPIAVAPPSLARNITSTPVQFGLEEFLDLGAPEPGSDTPTYGRSWSAAELRLKSNEDLQKLWYVLLKERNMLMTEHAAARAQGARMRDPVRRRLVRKSMARIKVVLGERCRAVEEQLGEAVGPQRRKRRNRKWRGPPRGNAA